MGGFTIDGREAEEGHQQHTKGSRCKIIFDSFRYGMNKEGYFTSNPAYYIVEMQPR